MPAAARLRIALSLSLAIGSSVACGSVAPAPSAPPSTTAPANAGEPSAPSASLLRDRGWQRTSVARFALTLELPDAEGWQQSSSPGWARFEHRASHSRLELNLSRAERLARPEACEARARLEHPELPRPAEGEALDRLRIQSPRGFLSYATLSVNEAGAGELEGHVTTFGAAVGRCFALHFVTRVAGAGAENEVARRLGLIIERVLPSLELGAVDDRVSPTPFSSPDSR